MLRIASRPVKSIIAGLATGIVLLRALTPALRPPLGDTPPSPRLLGVLLAASAALLGVIAAAALPAGKARKLEPAALLCHD